MLAPSIFRQARPCSLRASTNLQQGAKPNKLANEQRRSQHAKLARRKYLPQVLLLRPPLTLLGDGVWLSRLRSTEHQRVMFYIQKVGRRGLTVLNCCHIMTVKGTFSPILRAWPANGCKTAPIIQSGARLGLLAVLAMALLLLKSVGSTVTGPANESCVGLSITSHKEVTFGRLQLHIQQAGLSFVSLSSHHFVFVQQIASLLICLVSKSTQDAVRAHSCGCTYLKDLGSP